MTIKDLKNEIEKEENEIEKGNNEKLKNELQEVVDTIVNKIENSEYDFDVYCDYDLIMLSKKDYLYSPLDMDIIYDDGVIFKRIEKFILSLDNNYYVLTDKQFPIKDTKKKYGKNLHSIKVDKITKDEAKKIVSNL